MKIRTGFVSNSSSSSFTILGWGVEMAFEDIVNKEYFIGNEEFLKKRWNKELIKDEEYWHEYIKETGTYELIEFVSKLLGLSIEDAGEYDESMYIGIKPDLGCRDDYNTFTDHELIDRMAEKLKDLNDLIQRSEIFSQKFKDYVLNSRMGYQSACWREG